MDSYYEQIVINSLLQAIKDILYALSCNKLSDFCLYITFCSSAKGVVFPNNIEKDESDMITIVLQNQFWNLIIEEEGFHVTLNFMGKKYDIYIPYRAICLFSDPMQDFLLDFRSFYTKMDLEDNNEDKDDIIFLDFSNAN